MATKYRNLFDKIANREALWKAYRKASKGKRKTLGYLQFRQYEAANIEKLLTELQNGTYKPGTPRVFMIFEPKERKITALPFIDRVVQHAIHAVIEPVFDKTFLPNSFACRKGRGTHKAIKTLQGMLRKTSTDSVLKLDVKSYFHKIDLKILWESINKKIKCKKTTDLLALFHPKEGMGIPIGNLTSQLLANVYGSILDKEIKTFNLDFVRYMDDIIILGNKRDLKTKFTVLTDFLKTMVLYWSKWSISKNNGINFLGHRIFKRFKLVKKDFKHKVRRRLKTGKDLEQYRTSILGHLMISDSYNLKNNLLKGNI